MSYQSNQPRHTTPLIARPSTSRPPAGLAPPQGGGARPSFLGNAIAGALGGMGMGMGPPPMSWQLAGGPVSWGPGSGPQQGMHHPLPMAPHLSGYGGGYQPQQFQQPYQGFGHPQQQFQEQPYYQQPPPPPFAHPLPHPATAPRTTAEGYTISSAYVAPPPEPPSNNQRGPGNAGSGRGGARGRGRGGGGGERAGGQGPGRGAPNGEGGGGVVAKCSHAGCSFEGQRKAVREHEEDRHLIYAPGKEPKAWVGSYKAPDGVRIEGTSISLDSPEAIAKWIEERKKKWPSAKVVEVKELQRSERIAAGLEAPPRSGRGGRGGRGRGAERGVRGGRGRGRGGAGSWSTRDDDEGGRDAKRAKTAPQSDGSSSGSSSNSDSDDSGDDGPPIASSSKIPVEGLFDAPGADAAAVSRTPDVGGRPTIHPSRLQAARTEEEAEESKASSAVKEFQVVCKQWRKGNCAQGDNCQYLHSLPPNSSAPAAPPKRKRPAPPAPPHNPFARPDPFAQLAERDIAHVVSDVLYALEFFQQNDWLRGVEGRVGELEEEGGIEELEELAPPAAGIEELDAPEPLVVEQPEEDGGVIDSDEEMDDSGGELEISRTN